MYKGCATCGYEYFYQNPTRQNLLYTGNYNESYEILEELEYNVGKNNTYYNDIKRLLGVVLYKMNQLDSSIEN